MGKLFRTVGMAAGIGGITASAHALQAIELIDRPWGGDRVVPALGVAYPAAWRFGEAAPPLDSRWVGWAPSRLGGIAEGEAVAASWAHAGPAVPTVSADLYAVLMGRARLEAAPARGDESGWGTEVMGGLVAAAFLMWRRMHFQ
jgi:hypothetical protein